MDRPHICVSDSVFPSLEPARAVLSPLDPVLRAAASTAPADIVAAAHDADALLVTYAKITAEVIAGLDRCKVIGRFGIGVDNIDIAAASARGIVVTYVPDYCAVEVADHTMAMLLALARKIAQSNALVQAGRWEMPAVVPLRRLSDRILGLVGCGGIARQVIPRAQAFGLKVAACDPQLTDEAAADLGVEKVGFEHLLEISDFVSLHVPLTKATAGLFDAEVFWRMKRGAVLINTARGPLVDQRALVAALDEGLIAGAALDVVPVEPLPKDSPLLGRDNVILSPHTAFYSEEALVELQTKAATDVLRVLSGERPVYPVNPQVLA